MSDNRRFFITGNAGSGKTTLAKRMSKELNIPYYSLDSIVWQSGWKTTPLIKKQELISNLLKHNEWIIEGVSKDVLVVADVVIFLDLSRFTCFKRLVKRNIKYLFKTRPELPANCPEIKVVFKLIKIVWNFKKVVRPTIIKYISMVKNSKKVIIYHLSQSADVNKFKI